MLLPLEHTRLDPYICKYRKLHLDLTFSGPLYLASYCLLQMPFVVDAIITTNISIQKDRLTKHINTHCNNKDVLK